MAIGLLARCAAFVPRLRVESLLRPQRRVPPDGVALIADISGFTPLTEALARGLRADQGAEELTHALNGVFAPLIDQIHAWRGSVMKFAGDALLVWYERERGLSRADVVRRALASATQMQAAIATHGQIATPIGAITLKMKIGLAYGPARWLSLGLPEFGYEDTLVGATLDRMAEAEHHAQPGEIVADTATLGLLPPEAVMLSAPRDGFASILALRRPIRPNPWPPVRWPDDADGTLAAALTAYIPCPIYETLVAGGAQVAELKPVVSLFVQFHGLDYDADPDVAAKLQAYFAAAQRTVAAYGGRLNRLITGDKGSVLHILFGAPRTVEEQEARAVACALDLQQEAGRLPFITMQRIGVAAGRVFAGPLGSPQRHDYTTMGDAINLSARLMQNAAPHQILLDAGVRDRLGDGFDLADLGALRVKGKAEPVAVFAALGRRSTGETRQAHRVASIVGRDAEMARLQRRLADVTGGRGGIVTLVGDVGMGKTLLLDTLRAEYAGRVTWADGIGLAYGQTLSAYLFIALLRDLLRLPPGAGPDEAAARLSDFCADLFGPARLDATYPYLARLMGLPLGGDAARRVEGLAGENFRWQVFDVFAEMLRLLAARGPLVLALDDVQWADTTSLQLLESLLPLFADTGILLLIALRPERDGAAWALRQRIQAQWPDAVTDIPLGLLPHDAAARLVSQLAPRLPERIVTHLVEKGGGNPLFLTELVRTLQARGLLADDADLASLSPDALDLPDSVHGLLLAQIDRLAVEARHTLQMASVIGTEFLYRVLEAIAAGESRVAESLAALQAGDYVLPDEKGELGLSYLFRHALIQESAYSTLLYQRRRAYHQGVARALERLFPVHIGEQSAILAYHYERADDWEQAIAYHLHTADQARLLYAHEEAESLYRKVLHLLAQQAEAGAPPDEERRARIYLKIAQVRANALDFEGAEEYYEQAFALFERIGREQPPVAADGRPRTFRAGVYEQGPPTLDPGLCQYNDVEVITYDLFEGLVELDGELNVLPAMARRWHVDDGGRRYTFELEPGLRWSDGTPLTAHDFVFAWRRNLDPATNAPLAHYLHVIRGAEPFHSGADDGGSEALGLRALDDETLQVELAAPVAYFPYLLADPITFPQPAHAVRRHGEEWAAPQRFVGNGAYRIAEWRQGEEIRLERNPYYRGHQPGNLESVSLRFVTPGLESFESDVIDWCRVEDQPDVSERYPDGSFAMQPLCTFFLLLNCRRAPFDDVRVRRAFAHSVDRRMLVKEDSADVMRPAFGGVVPPGVPGHSPEIGLVFDPALARDGLMQTGQRGVEWPELTLAAPVGSVRTPALLRDGWERHLGVRVRLAENLTVDEQLQQVENGEAHIALMGYDLDYPDPEAILRGLMHSRAHVVSRYFGWRHDRFDELVDRAARASDAPSRLAAFHEADRLLVAEEAAVIPLYYRRMVGVIRPGFALHGAPKVVRAGTIRLKRITVMN